MKKEDRQFIASELVKVAKDLIAIKTSYTWESKDAIVIKKIIESETDYGTKVDVWRARYPTTEISFSIYPWILRKELDEISKEVKREFVDNIAVSHTRLRPPNPRAWNLDDDESYTIVSFELRG